MKNFTKSNMVEVTENVIEVSPDILLFPDKSNYPVLKIDTNGKILYANNASFECLRDWLSGKSAFLPKHIIHVNPNVLNPDADFSISVNEKTGVFNFDVIGFRESGFIGLYGFNSLRAANVNNPVHEIERAC
jgi:hypothetical protein